MPDILEHKNQIYIDDNKQSLKGNLHTHTDRFDGAHNLDDVLEIYRKNNYDFLAITDHDMYYEGEMDDKYGNDMILLHGIEASCTYAGNDSTMGDYVHFICLERKDESDTEFKVGCYQNTEEIQEYLNTLNQKYQLVQFNHPLFSKLLDGDFIRLEGYHLFEIYNHKDYRWETGMESAEWLARVLLNHNKKILVTANDDFHGPYSDVKFGEAFGGFIMVQAEKNKTAILNAIKLGRFYASTGPQIFYYAREGQSIKIHTSEVKRIIFYSNLRRCKNVYNEDDSTFNQAECVLNGKEKYIWTKVVDSEGKAAWTQPIFLID